MGGDGVVYPRIQGGIAWFVDAVLLHRPDYTTLRTRIGEVTQRHQQLAPMLDEVCHQLAPALSARHVRWRESPTSTVTAIAANRAIVDIPVAEAPHYLLEVSNLAGGRRLLSDDGPALETIVVLLGRRIDTIRLADERLERERREQDMGKLAAEAELRALRAQVNPHFLFNALTTIGYLIQTAPPRALETLMRLTALLRGVLRSEGEFTTLGREIALIESYLDIEHARFERRLTAQIDVPAPLRTLRVPPLIVQPIVENAIKHGISPQRDGGSVTVRARLDESAARRTLVLTVRDTGAGASNLDVRNGRRLGVGLANIERRLAYQYGDAAAFVASKRTRRWHDRRNPGTRRRRRRSRSASEDRFVNARLRVVIADDERPARSFLAALLRTFDDVTIVAEAESGKEAVAAIERERPDLALLDLQMPELDGFGVVRMLKKSELPLVAFVTAYDEYAVRAFEVNAVDYLLKPVERARLRETINRAQERSEHAEIVSEQATHMGTAIAAYESAARPPFLERIPIRRRDEILILPVSDIASVIAEGELLHLTTTRHERHTLTYRLKDLESRLDPARFVRLGRGTLANIDVIVKVHVMPGGTHVAQLSNGQKLQISRLQSRFVRERLLKL